MAGAPRFKVYSRDGEYVAATKRPEEAGAVVSMLGNGATIRDGHSPKRIVWTEGVDGHDGASYDVIAETVYARCAH